MLCMFLCKDDKKYAYIFIKIHENKERKNKMNYCKSKGFAPLASKLQ